jgi:hypothetical protein
MRRRAAGESERKPEDEANGISRESSGVRSNVADVMTCGLGRNMWAEEEQRATRRIMNKNSESATIAVKFSLCFQIWESMDGDNLELERVRWG